MSSIPDAIHALSREGDSLKARFFRWKDRITRGRGIAQLFPDHNWIEVGIEVGRITSEEAKAARVAMGDLQDNPDDVTAYEAAVSSFRALVVKIKELGGDVDPDVPL
jgi:hypothetical protein